ncbi:MAG: hypothetical protein HY537_05750, partial [Deltaproteobacteria bacterium]|nr:hypothetical protein [Deltaproteobacteria bacterium]
YGLYLIHMPAWWLTWETAFRFHLSRPYQLGFYLLVLGVLVEASYRLLEQPFIRWSHRITAPAPSAQTIEPLSLAA